MKFITKKCWRMIATLALMVTVSSVNTTCGWLIYQPEVPDKAKVLRKF